ncbi:hypothetical protein J2S13_002494 [Oikeobacillus pervagus]|uniref:Uncharacterized protein n=1 Tax=Oikeobacillus pervagus TaxID=1325931 RepID=A0AAJ1T2P9_9BACI|nr:hypothetical protein [Oikeobacillus pervagus]
MVVSDVFSLVVSFVLIALIVLIVLIVFAVEVGVEEDVAAGAEEDVEEDSPNLVRKSSCPCIVIAGAFSMFAFNTKGL